MSTVADSDTAAGRLPEKPEVDGGPASGPVGDGGGAGSRADDVVAALVALTIDVLRAFREPGSGQVELPALLTDEATAVVDRGVAERVEPELSTLRRFLQDDARSDVTRGGGGNLSPAAFALRSLLELVLSTRLALPADEPDRKLTPDADLAAVCRAAADAVEPRDATAQTWCVRNLTDDELRFRLSDGRVWVLPAFGLRAIHRDPRDALSLRPAEARGEIQVFDPPAPKTPAKFDILLSYVYLLPASLAAIFFWGGTWGWVLGICGLVAPGAFVLLSMARKNSERLWGVARELPAWLHQAVTFLVVLAFCLAVPAVTLYYGASLEPVVSRALDGNATPADQLTLVCRSMQLVLIAIVSMLPALLYYQFDRDRLSTLREKFVQQIFRLDSRLKTRGAIYAKYGSVIDEIYGPERSGRFRRLSPGRRAPIFVATVLIMLGWLLVLLNPDVGLIRATNGVTAEAKIAELFQPRQTTPAFAFLGAYFFTLFALLRGYVRRDLRPKSYSDISVRIVTVVILAWVLELMFDVGPGLLVFAFLAGIVPQAALNRLRELWQLGLPRLPLPGLKGKRAGGAGSSPAAPPGNGGRDLQDDDLAAALADPLPLTDLEGIDLYDRTRLASEGVTNIEALAHHDLIELMLVTRIPVPRLVDWTDQAILHLHVDKEDRKALRRYGIRTASDLESAHRKTADKDAFLKLLDGAKAGPQRRLEVILGAMEDEEWMDCIRSWHDYPTRPAATNGTESE